MESSSPRAVRDTNTLISAALSTRGAPREVLLRVAERGVLLTSGDTVEEFVTRLRRPKFDAYLDVCDREEYIAWILARAERVEVTQRIAASRDPDDDKFLELAVCGRVDVIISGDHDLTSRHPFRESRSARRRSSCAPGDGVQMTVRRSSARAGESLPEAAASSGRSGTKAFTLG